MAKSDPNLLTQAEYARSRKARGLSGGSREAVRKAVDEKRISVFGPDKLLDEHMADSQWERNTRARLSPQAAEKPMPPIEPGLFGQPQAPSPTPAPPLPVSVVDNGYTAARARREVAEAEQAEIELKKIRGDLVAREDVDRGGFEVARELRDTMESAVNSLAAELATLTNAEACAEVIRRHNRAVCDVLVKGWREKIGPLPAGGLA